MTSANHALIDSIRSGVIGEGTMLNTPFGQRPLIYADYTASGRSLSFIEDFIRDQVMPFYANTHTEASATGRQTTAYREQARQLIKNSVNADDSYELIFSGSGATGAIHKLIDILNFRLPDDLNRSYSLAEHIPENARPVVFIGPYEHHSNELPWRESIADVVAIELDSQGKIDLQLLEQKLQQYSDRKIKIGSFSAASNVTGLLTDVNGISRLLHQHSALAFWDYAAAAPYVEIDIQGDQADFQDSSKDAVFISPHKFVGGPGTPGILIVKKSLLNNRVPSVPGGGTVSFVTPDSHTYVADTQRREEGGTPAIIEAVRAGLVFKLKDSVGAEEIERRESTFVRRALDRWQSNPNICVLGNLEAPRTAIVSLQILRDDKPLHHGFVVALLNDLFGIQARGGCSCAGPYAHHLLGLSEQQSQQLEQAIHHGHSVLRPGWVRINFNYFFDEPTFNFLIQAIEILAEHGWKLLSRYHYDTDSGIWSYRNEKNRNVLRNLNDICFVPLQNSALDNTQHQVEVVNIPFTRYLQQARELLTLEYDNEPAHNEGFHPEVESLRWFYLPNDEHQL